MFTGSAKFELGQVVGTPQALRFCGEHDIDILAMLARHASGDWGDLPPDDVKANQTALVDGSRLLSAYHFPAGKVWVLTEAAGDDGRRHSTCLMLPADY